MHVELAHHRCFWCLLPKVREIENQIDRFTIAIAAIDRVPRIRVLGAHAKDKFRNEQIACCNYEFENGIDKPEIVEWKWPY
jgi:xylulose-5-phosphate/fructose-6-phosphate phosphoketolase